MPHPVTIGKRTRMSFSKIKEIADVPNLIELQVDSYKWFIEEGLKEVFEDISPIEDYTGNLILEFVDYSLDDKPKYDIEECKDRDATYCAPLKVKVRLINKETGEIKEQEVFMGDFPLMTEKGTFVINGAERVIVSQLVRSPGVYYALERDKTGKKLISSTVIPNRGAWLEYETDSNDVISVRVDRTRKQPVTVLLRALGIGTDAEIIELLGEDERLAATLEKDGSIDDTCVNCGDVRKSTPIAKIASIDLDKTSFTENGQAQKPSVTVKDSTGAVISADNYTVSYSDANSTKAGTYKVTVKFNGKKYAGTKELSYTISAKPAATTTVTNAATVKAPAKTTVKLSKAKKTSIKVSWKKVSGVAAYQIQYSTSKNFKKAKTVKVSAKSASKVLKKLKKNKKYYVRVRSYKVTKVNNKSKNVYSAWSAKKALKTKKK